MKKRVLVVDDDIGVLESIQTILEFEGYDVDVTLRGEEVYTKIQSEKPDIILLDYLLSGCIGSDIASHLKQKALTSKIPIILLSAHPAARKVACDCGADEFISKPFDMHKLLSTVRKLTSSN
jgi:DNA-binding response OmpR family regulator